MTAVRPKASGTAPVFFLSYPRPAAADRFWSGDSEYVAFYHELCAALARLVPPDRLHGLGALSPERSPAETGVSENAARAISECDVFLPLHSPRYFDSEACGRELAAFEARISRAGTSRATAIVPVLWAPVSPQWGASQPPPYRSGNDDVDEEYLAKGLIWLQSTYPNQYRRVVADLARRIADISTGRPVGRGAATDLASVQSSLRKAERQSLVVVLLAPTLGRPPGAESPGYGERITDWVPFAAESGAVPLAGPRGQLASLARAKGWEPEVVSFSEDDLRLFGPRGPDVQVVLVVDVRALDDPRWRAALTRFDRLDKPGVGVVAVADPEGTAPPEQTRLKDQLMRVLEHKFARRRPSLRLSAPIATSLRLFDQALDAVANDTRIRLANRPLTRNHHSAEEETSQ